MKTASRLSKVKVIATLCALGILAVYYFVWLR